MLELDVTSPKFGTHLVSNGETLLYLLVRCHASTHLRSLTSFYFIKTNTKICI